MSLSTKFAGLSFEGCIYNAAGPRTFSIDALSKIGSSKSCAIVSKSTTLLKREGNPLPRTVSHIDLGYQLCQGSFNSEGLPNEGFEYCKLF